MYARLISSASILFIILLGLVIQYYFGHLHVKAFSESLASKFEQMCKAELGITHNQTLGHDDANRCSNAEFTASVITNLSKQILA